MADSKSARPATRYVKNLQSVPLFLSDMDGDDVQIPVGANVPVERRFLDYQMPSMASAFVEGYDYVNNRFADEQPAALEPTPVEEAIAANTAEPTPTPPTAQAAPTNNNSNNSQYRPNNSGSTSKGSN